MDLGELPPTDARHGDYLVLYSATVLSVDQHRFECVLQFSHPTETYDAVVRCRASAAVARTLLLSKGTRYAHVVLTPPGRADGLGAHLDEARAKWDPGTRVPPAATPLKTYTAAIAAYNRAVNSPEPGSALALQADPTISIGAQIVCAELDSSPTTWIRLGFEYPLSAPVFAAKTGNAQTVMSLIKPVLAAISTQKQFRLELNYACEAWSTAAHRTSDRASGIARAWSLVQDLGTRSRAASSKARAPLATQHAIVDQTATSPPFLAADPRRAALVSVSYAASLICLPHSRELLDRVEAAVQGNMPFFRRVLSAFPWLIDIFFGRVARAPAGSENPPRELEDLGVLLIGVLYRRHLHYSALQETAADPRVPALYNLLLRQTAYYAEAVRMVLSTDTARALLDRMSAPAESGVVLRQVRRLFHTLGYKGSSAAYTIPRTNPALCKLVGAQCFGRRMDIYAAFVATEYASNDTPFANIRTRVTPPQALSINAHRVATAVDGPSSDNPLPNLFEPPAYRLLERTDATGTTVPGALTGHDVYLHVPSEALVDELLAKLRDTRSDITWTCNTRWTTQVSAKLRRVIHLPAPEIARLLGSAESGDAPIVYIQPSPFYARVDCPLPTRHMAFLHDFIIDPGELLQTWCRAHSIPANRVAVSPLTLSAILQRTPGDIYLYNAEFMGIGELAAFVDACAANQQVFLCGAGLTQRCPYISDAIQEPRLDVGALDVLDHAGKLDHGIPAPSGDDAPSEPAGSKELPLPSAVSDDQDIYLITHSRFGHAPSDVSWRRLECIHYFRLLYAHTWQPHVRATPSHETLDVAHHLILLKQPGIPLLIMHLDGTRYVTGGRASVASLRAQLARGARPGRIHLLINTFYAQQTHQHGKPPLDMASPVHISTLLGLLDLYYACHSDVPRPGTGQPEPSFTVEFDPPISDVHFEPHLLHPDTWLKQRARVQPLIAPQ